MKRRTSRRGKRPYAAEPLERRLLLAAGDLDSSFGNGGTIYSYRDSTRFRAVVVQSDNKIVAGGTVIRPDGMQDFLLERFDANGLLDATFGNAGKVTTDIGGGSDEIMSLAIQSDGRIVAAGTTTVLGVPTAAMVRYLPNGAVDQGFGTGGDIVGVAAFASVVALQPDGKIVTAFQSLDHRVSNGLYDGIFRYNTDGSPDMSFAFTSHAVAPQAGCAVAIQPDGEIILAGGDTSQVIVARVLANGNLDTSLGSGGVANIPFTNTREVEVALQDDGRIVVAASVEGSNPVPNLSLARLNGDGALDHSFGNGGTIHFDSVIGQGNFGLQMAINSAGKIDVAGRFELDFAVQQFTSTGARDVSFGQGGEALTSLSPEPGWNNGTAYGLALRSDGGILAAGFVGLAENTSQSLVASWNADGSVDNSFGTKGFAADTFVDSVGATNDVAIQSDGKIVTAGWAIGPQDNFDFAISRYLPNGTLDTSFGQDGTVLEDFLEGGDRAVDLILQPNGDILVAGGASVGFSGSEFAMLRLLPDGTLDPNFGTDGKVTNQDIISQIALENDGSIIGVGTDFFTNHVDIFRFQSNGQPDLSFGTNGMIGAPFMRVTKALIQADGKILIGGIYPGQSDDFGLYRFNSDGSADTSFGNNGIDVINRTINVIDSTTQFPSTDDLYAMAVLSGGKILIAGAGGVVARLNPDGTVDGTFGLNGYAFASIGNIQDLALQTDQSILLVGNSFSPERIVLSRMTADGSIDLTFGNDGIATLSLPHGASAAAAALENDGGLVLAGATLDSPLLARIQILPPQAVSLQMTGSSFYLRRGANNANLELFSSSVAQGAANYVAPLADVVGISLTGTAFNDRLVLDYSNGDPIPAVGFTYNGGGGTDTVAINGTPVNPIHLSFGSGTPIFSIMPGNVVFDQGWTGGSLNATVNVQTGASLEINSLVHFAALNVNSGSSVKMIPGSGAVMRLGSLSIFGTGRVDLSDNAVIVDYSGTSPIGVIRSYIAAGRAAAAGTAGSWSGAGGIDSSLAATSGNGFNVAVGYANNGALAGLPGGSYTSFFGQTVGTNSILIRTTRGADANLDGSVDATDMTIVSQEFGKANSGQWCLGDFDYSGTCDNSDVTTLGATFGKTIPALSGPQVVVGTAAASVASPFQVTTEAATSSPSDAATASGTKTVPGKSSGIFSETAIDPTTNAAHPSAADRRQHATRSRRQSVIAEIQIPA